MKNRYLHIGLFIVFAIVVVPFTNCSSFSNTTQASGISTLDCTTPNCVIPDPTILKITANTANGEYDVPAALSEFNIGGDCNEGGFPYNQVHWELWDSSSSQNTPVRTSSYGIASGQSADSKCINGRFMVYVYLGPVTGDNVDRTGLATAYSGTGRGAYLLKIYIYGYTAPIVSPVITAYPTNPPVYSYLNSLTSLPLSAF